MKFFTSRFLGIVLKLSAVLAVCIGCSSKPDEAPKPSPIHWHGPETGYTGTTSTKTEEGQ